MTGVSIAEAIGLEGPKRRSMDVGFGSAADAITLPCRWLLRFKAYVLGFPNPMFPPFPP